MNDKPVALVTGANKGIGLQIAKGLAVHGLTVLVGARNLEAGEEAARESRATPTSCNWTSRTTLRSPPRRSASGGSSVASTCS